MVRRAAIWAFSTQIASFVIQFGASIIIARLLSPSEFGIYALALAVIGIVQLFGTFSVGLYVIREEKFDVRTLDTAYTINLVMSGILSGIIFGSSFVASALLDEPNVLPVLQILALGPIISIIAFRPNVMLQRGLQFRGISLLGTMTTLVSAIVTIATAYQGASSMSPAYGNVVSTAFGAVGTLAIGRQYHSARTSLVNWRPMIAFGLRLISISGISSAAVRVTDVVLGHLLGLAALGLYSRASNLANMLFTNVYGAATRVVFAKLADAQRKDDLNAVYLRGFRLIIGVMGPIDLGLAVLSKPTVRLLYGDKWVGAAVPLSFLLIAQFISLGFAMNWELFLLRDDLKTQTKLELVRSVLGVVTKIIGCFISIGAVAASAIFDAVVSIVIYNPHISRLSEEPKSAFYKLYGEVSLLSSIAALPAFILMTITGWDANTPLLMVFGSIAFGVGLWVWAIFWRGHPLRHEILLAFEKLRTRGA